MKKLSTLYYHVGLEELSVKELGLMLERDPTSDSYTIYARDSFLDLIRKDPACIQFMTVMKTRWEATAANLDEGPLVSVKTFLC